MNRQLLALSFAIAATIPTRIAHAEERDCAGEASCVSQPASTDLDRWAGRPLSLVGIAGFGTPVGLVGAMAEWAPATAFVLAGGVGAGFDGVQAAAMARGRLVLSRAVAVTLGGGVSGGGYTYDSKAGSFCFSCQDDPDMRKHWRVAVWGNGEVGLELRHRKGLTVRGFLGVGKVLNPSAYACTGTLPCDNSGTLIPYLGAAVGYAFEL